MKRGDKVITHEEARKTMMKIESDDVYYGEFKEEHKIMATYITQQEAKEDRAKKVEELLTYQNHYIDSIVIELDRITNKAKASQIEIIKKELGEMK